MKYNAVALGLKFVVGVLLVNVSLASSAFANSTNEAMYTMVKNMMLSDAAMKELDVASACLGVPAQKLQSSMTKALDHCYNENKDVASGFSEKLMECFEPAMIKFSGVSQAKLDACDPEKASLADEEDDYKDLTPEELMAEQRLRQQEMQDTMAMVSQASEKTLHLITLPIYPNSKVAVHALEGAELGGVKTLPAATFSSSDSAQKIFEYYKKQLPKYKTKSINGRYILMENMPDTFDLDRDYLTISKIPHVLITPPGQGVPSTLIQIAYKR